MTKSIYKHNCILAIESEARKYLDATSRLDRGGDPEQCWKLHSTRFLSGSIVARNLFAVQASSATSERSYSTAVSMIADKWCSLSDAAIRACTCLTSRHCVFASKLIIDWIILQ